MTRAAIYADINPNAIDGSSIWMMSITEVLSKIFDEVWVVLKTAPVDQRLVQSVNSISNVVLDFDTAKDGSMERTIPEAANRAEEIHNEYGLDAIVVRGLEACLEFSKRSSIAEVLWSYVTDLPYPTHKLSNTNRSRLERVAQRSAGLFSQTEASRAYYESLAPSAAGKTFLMPPMIPNSAFVEKPVESEDLPMGGLKLVYAGKLAEDWKTLDLVWLPSELKKLGIESTLYLVGEKINRGVTDPGFAAKMKATLHSAQEGEFEGVVALGSLPRAKSIELIQSADIGIGWRTASLDSSLEVSTKALEYSAAGTPPVINRNADHERLFGNDYPFFVSADATAKELAELLAENYQKLASARMAASSAALPYSMNAAEARLRNSFKRRQVGDIGTEIELKPTQEPTKIVVASHDLKFAGELVSRLQKDRNFEVRFDHWETLHKHDKKHSLACAEWADAVFCEFAGPNLAFYSQNIKPEARLVGRLHGFEVRNRAPWLAQVDLDNVDQLITVSDHYAQMTLDFLPKLGTRIGVISNMVDTVDFDRPKSAEARFHIGLVGMVPFLKRPDRALELLKRLIEVDDRYVLHIKGRMPWDYPFIWKDKIQRYQYLDFFRKVYSDIELTNHVQFDPFSTDIASWMRGIGIVLSPSDNESFHLAPAEGMASGAIPIVWQRDGAASVFGEHNVFTSLEDMTERIVSLSSESAFVASSQNAKAEAARWDYEGIYDQWREKLLYRKRTAS